MDKEIKTFSCNSKQIKVDSNLALRFLRVRKEPDENTKEIFKECMDEFLSVVNYKAAYRYFDIKTQDNKVYFDNDMVLESTKLVKCLDKCTGAFVFVATTTTAVDRLILKHSKLNRARSVIIDAIGSAAIESFCDVLCQKIQSDNNVCFRPRFSPGYGDLSILCQQDVLKCVDSARKIGVSLTDRYMMIPTKSVSAIVGVRPQGEFCTKASSCEICEDMNCPYRE